MTPTIWSTPNRNSQHVCEAVARGTGFPIKPVQDVPTPPGPSVVYGVLRGCSEVMARCQVVRQPYWHIDHGYFQRSPYDTFTGYYRISRDGTAANEIKECDDERWKTLNIEVQPWRSQGKNVLILPPTIPIAAHYKESPIAWAEYVRDIILRTGLNPVVRLKNSANVPFGEALKDAYAVIAFNSNAAIDALVAGVPAWQQVGPLRLGNVNNFLTATKPTRERFFRYLATQQWTLDEIRAGKANGIFDA